MGSINNWGVAPDSVTNAPPLGGVGGWAEAVAAVLGNSDQPVDERIAAGGTAGVFWGRWAGTQAEYDALGAWDPNTLYAIVG